MRETIKLRYQSKCWGQKSQPKRNQDKELCFTILCLGKSPNRPSSVFINKKLRWDQSISWVISLLKTDFEDFPGSTVVKNPPANAGDRGSNPGPGRSHMPWSN